MATVTVTGRPQPLTEPGAGSVLLANLDTAVTVYVDSSRGVSTSSTKLAPLGSLTVDGTTQWWAVTAAGQTAELQVTPGGSSYAPGSLQISGPVTAEISGPVTVSGTVDLAAGTAVEISGTPSVTVSGTPTVDLAAGATVDISGTADVNVANATLDVVGKGGYILPGTTSTLFSQTTATTVGPGAQVTVCSGVSVTGSNSLDIVVSGIANSARNAGCAWTVAVAMLFYDADGNTVGQEIVNLPCGQAGSAYTTVTVPFSVPCRGSTVDVVFGNIGSAGTITVGGFVMNGSYRSLSRIEFSMPALSACWDISVGGISWTVIPLPSYPPRGAIAEFYFAASPAASTTWGVILPPWVGQAAGQLLVQGNNLAAPVTIVDLGGQTCDNVPAGVGNHGVAWIGSVATGTVLDFDINLGSSCYALLFEADVAFNISFSLTGRQ